MSVDNQKNDFALVPKPPRAIEIAKPGTKRILSGMVADTLALVKKVQRPKPRIVWVDDDAEFVQMVESVICNEFTVLKFQNGEQAWRELQQQDPDILVTDILRPNDAMDGWVMIPLLAEKKVTYPIVVVSAYREFSAEFENEIFKADAAKFRSFLQQARRTLNIRALAKPFENEELLKLLNACLETGKTPRKARPLGIIMVCSEPAPFQSLQFVIRLWFKDATFHLFQDNSEEAWQELSRTDPDLLIMADAMPGLRGQEISRRLLDRKATYPIIVTFRV